MSVKIKNPILKGFHPDPCICKADGVYYIATSTFEWYPGVQIHKSTDLVRWELASCPLTYKEQMDLAGVPDSAGIWAPALSFADGQFWLVYTVVRGIDGIFKDLKNYVTVCKTVDGEWSKPVYIHSSGFDPSLFHDSDGKKYIINMLWDYRTSKGHVKFNGILLQEYSHKDEALVGERKIVFTGSATGGTEGAHIMQKDGWYYMIAAEGGTGRHHSIVVARSKDVWGPYEISPFHPLITSIHDPENLLRKAGHGNFVETDQKEWFLVHLCARYLDNKLVCSLGRETALQNIEWVNGWPKLQAPSNAPLVTINAPRNTVISDKEQSNDSETHFESPDLPKEFMTLRTPFTNKISLQTRKSHLRIFGGESLTSVFNQSIIARKWQSVRFSVGTSIEFFPTSYQQMAGLVCYYNTRNWIFAYISHDEKSDKRVLNVLMNDNMNFCEPLRSCYIYVSDTSVVHIKVEVLQEWLQYYYSLDGKTYYVLGPQLDASILSDEHSIGWAYTGAVVGMTVIDLAGNHSYADFDYFTYHEK
jgi:xylan 1,4-beta-xylosidase